MNSSSTNPNSGWLKYEILGVVIYVAIGFLGLETASLHQLTGAVWFASGFAIAWLGHRGASKWPTIAVGAFILNAMTISAGKDPLSILEGIPTAVMIAAGNTCEALLGGYALVRFVGSDPFSHPVRMLRFLVFVGVCPAFVSAMVGVMSIKVFDPGSASGLDIFTTWYFANMTGAIIVTPIALWLMQTRPLPAPIPNPIELLATAALLLLVLQPLLGTAYTAALVGWPKIYMVLPVLLWFCYRFGLQELFCALLLTVTLSVIGTLHGYAAFPATDSWQSLSYLQVFLAITASVCFMLKASVIEGVGYRRELEEVAHIRRLRLDGLLAERDVLNQLLVHDLQSPLAGMRGALEATRSMKPTSPEDIFAMEQVLDLAIKTCDDMLKRTRAILNIMQKDEPEASDAMTAREIIYRVLGSNKIEIDRKDLRVRLFGTAFENATRDHGLTALLALEVVIENAVRMSPYGGSISITTTTVDNQIHYEVADEGPGVSATLRETLLRQPVESAGGSGGVGLFLAHRALEKAGGRIFIRESGRHGTTFSVSITKEY